MSDEFTEREGLGDLDEQIAGERGDLQIFTKTAPPVDDAKGDVRYQNFEAHEPSEVGTIPFGANVIATYDSRFVNGIDFNFTNFATWNITGAPPTALVLTIQYTVPAGYNAVIRNYRYEMEPAVPITYSDLLLDWFVDDVAQLGHQGLMHGQTVTTWIPTFILAQSGAVVTIRFRAPTGIASNPGDVRRLIWEMQGNLIQDTGAPLNFEIANVEGAGPLRMGKF
jgi:hypothetical protein